MRYLLKKLLFIPQYFCTIIILIDQDNDVYLSCFGNNLYIGKSYIIVVFCFIYYCIAVSKVQIKYLSDGIFPKKNILDTNKIKVTFDCHMQQQEIY